MTGLSAAVRIHSCSWHEMHRDATDLAVRLQALGSFHGIIAIARGGLVPAAIIARVLDVKLIETLCITSYDGPQGTLVGAEDGARRGRRWRRLAARGRCRRQR